MCIYIILWVSFMIYCVYMYIYFLVDVFIVFIGYLGMGFVFGFEVEVFVVYIVWFFGY